MTCPRPPRSRGCFRGTLAGISRMAQHHGFRSLTVVKLLEQPGVDGLLEALVERGYRLIGPTVADEAIVYEEIRSTADLPAGWTDEQDAGTYRLSAATTMRSSATRSGLVVETATASSVGHALPRQAERRGRAQLVDDTEEPEPMALFARATCTRSPSSTRSFSAGVSSTRSTSVGAAWSSSSPSTAASPHRRASASRWAPARGRRSGTTSR